ncbi:MAG: hypothetical protein AB1345_09950 [Chloroflexota bacterium]
MTEESKLVETDREVRAWTETCTRRNPAEVPSRAAQGNDVGPVDNILPTI